MLLGWLPLHWMAWEIRTDRQPVYQLYLLPLTSGAVSKPPAIGN